MKLVPVYPQNPKFHAVCLECGTLNPSSDLWADIEGKPFVAYYCDKCAAQLNAQTTEPKQD